MEDVLATVKEQIGLAVNHLRRGDSSLALRILEKLNADLLALEQQPLFKPVQGEFRNVRINDLQFKKLVIRTGSVPMANYYIRRLSSYMKSTRRNYNDHYATIISWYEDDFNHNKLPNLGTEKESKHGEPRYTSKS